MVSCPKQGNKINGTFPFGQNRKSPPLRDKMLCLSFIIMFFYKLHIFSHQAFLPVFLYPVNVSLHCFLHIQCCSFHSKYKK